MLSNDLNPYQIRRRPRLRTSAFWQRGSYHRRSKILKTLQNSSRYLPSLVSILSSKPDSCEQYKIVHKIRNNSKVTKEELITALANIVPEGHSVSLDDPELVILVNVYKVRIDQNRFSTYPYIESDTRISTHMSSYQRSRASAASALYQNMKPLSGTM